MYNKIYCQSLGLENEKYLKNKHIIKKHESEPIQKRKLNLQIDIENGWDANTYNISDEEDDLDQSPYKLGYSENYHDSIIS